MLFCHLLYHNYTSHAHKQQPLQQQQYKEFYKKEGHSRFPTTSRTDLAKFVTHVRSVYRAKKARAVKNDPNADPTTVGPDLSSSKLLTPERMQALMEINFEFQLWSVDQVSLVTVCVRVCVCAFIYITQLNCCYWC
jgi:CBS domain containing-hemolysin-like protein